MKSLRRLERPRRAPAPDRQEQNRSRPRRRRRWAVLCLVLPALGAAFWFYYSSVVALAIVEGNVLTITAPADVTVEEVYVEPGQLCEKGSPLAKLAATDVRAGRSVLETRLEQARLRLDLVERGAEFEDLRPDRRLDERDRLDAEAEAAEALLTAARARYAHAERERALYAELRANGQGAARELDVAETEAIAAQAELARAAANLAGLRARSQRHRSLVPADSDAAELRRTELALLKQGVREAEQRLGQFDYEHGTRAVLAPFAGRIDRVYIESGSHRDEGMPLLDLYDPESLHAIAYVEPGDREHFQIGTEVRMYPLGASQPVIGTISDVYQGWARLPGVLQRDLESARQVGVAVRIECDPAQRPLLAPNMVVKVLCKRR